MIIVNQWGGLGNQMFINAYVNVLIASGKKVKVDISEYSRTGLPEHSRYDLEKIFHIHQEIASPEECRVLRKPTVRKRILFTAIRYMFPDFREKSCIRAVDDDSIRYLPELLDIEDTYIEGYFQSEQYFMNMEDKVRKDYTFPSLDGLNKTIAEKIMKCQSVSVHIRRGDYSSKDRLDIKYYQNAIKYIEANVENPLFFVFSNDINWCKAYLGESEKFSYIDWNCGFESYIDMQLMSLCKHNIIANSSFSWWGGWLNQNQNKIVCAPDKWLMSFKKFPNGFSGDIIPDNWIKIER